MKLILSRQTFFGEILLRKTIFLLGECKFKFRNFRSKHPEMIKDATEILNSFQNMNIWRRGDERAPHKPLLALYALGKAVRNKGGLITFEEIDRKVSKLLADFGPPRKTKVVHPFWRMQGDQIWEVEKADEPEITKSGEPRKTDLLKKQISAGLPEPIYETIQRDGDLFRSIVKSLLNHFPGTYHDDLLRAVGIDLSEEVKTKTRRDPEFRSRVLRAYEYRRAVIIGMGTTTSASATTPSASKPPTSNAATTAAQAAILTRKATASRCAASTTGSSTTARSPYPIISKSSFQTALTAGPP